VAPPVLQGRRVRLRPVDDADLPVLYRWYNDAEVVAPYDRFAIDTYASFEAAIRGAPEDVRSQAPRFVVEPLDAPGHIIGMVGYYLAHPVLEIADIWYVLGDLAARGKGYGSEAVGLMVTHLFATTEYGRIGATCDVENLPSARLVERLGFRREGTFRDALFHHGRWHDVAVFGVTRSEWAARPARS
jgi:[ribosomal protein S5]-alanine N-acetyltransferase